VTTAELEQIAARVKALSPANRLRLAAGLLDAREDDLAALVARQVCDEIDFVKLFGRRPSDGTV